MFSCAVFILTSFHCSKRRHCKVGRYRDDFRSKLCIIVYIIDIAMLDDIELTSYLYRVPLILHTSVTSSALQCWMILNWQYSGKTLDSVFYIVQNSDIAKMDDMQLTSCLHRVPLILFYWFYRRHRYIEKNWVLIISIADLNVYIDLVSVDVKEMLTV